jgi:hypothetical protein
MITFIGWFYNMLIWHFTLDKLEEIVISRDARAGFSLERGVPIVDELCGTIEDGRPLMDIMS